MVETFRVNCPSLLRKTTQFERLIVLCLGCSFIFPRKLCIILPEVNRCSAVCDVRRQELGDLDGKLHELALGNSPPEFVFETSQPAGHLATWIHIVSECFPCLVGSGARVGIVCYNAEKSIAAEQWWL